MIDGELAPPTADAPPLISDVALEEAIRDNHARKVSDQEDSARPGHRDRVVQERGFRDHPGTLKQSHGPTGLATIAIAKHGPLDRERTVIEFHGRRRIRGKAIDELTSLDVHIGIGRRDRGEDHVLIRSKDGGFDKLEIPALREDHRDVAGATHPVPVRLSVLPCTSSTVSATEIADSRRLSAIVLSTSRTRASRARTADASIELPLGAR